MHSALRRALAGAAVLGSSAAACGRDGPVPAPSGPRTLTVAEPGAAGVIDVEVSGEHVATCPGTCGVVYEAGSRVVLTATGGAGRFDAWQDGAALCAGQNPCVFHPFTNLTVGVRWLADLGVGIDADHVSWGRITSSPGTIDCPGPPGACDGAFVFGTTVTLTATPSGTFFRGWGGACAGADTAHECTLDLVAPLLASARFAAFEPMVLGSAASADYAEAVAADPSEPGAFVATGSFQAPGITLGPGATLPHAGGRNAFVARWSSGGVESWRIGGAGDVSPHAIAAAAEGGTFAAWVAGSFSGTVDLDGDGAGETSGVSSPNGFVVKLRGGEPAAVWTAAYRSTDANSRAVATGVDVDAAGNAVVVTGVTALAVDFDGTTLSTGNANRHQFFDTLHDADDGDLRRVQRVGRNAASHGEGTAVVFSGGDPVTAGFATADLNDTCARSLLNNDQDGILYRFAADDFGACTWIAGADFGGLARWTGLATRGPAPEVAAVGLDEESGFAIAVRAYDALTGAVRWTSAPIAATALPGPFAIDYDAGRDEYVIAGSFSGAVSAGGHVHPSRGGRDILVARFAADDGVLTGLFSLGGARDDVAGGPLLPPSTVTSNTQGYASRAIAVLDSSISIVAGWTLSTSLDGVPTRAAPGIPDAVLLRVAPGPSP